MGSYSALWAARVRLLRPGNGAMAAAAVLIGGILATDPAWALTGSALAAALAAFLITGFGNVLNDLVDVDLDRTAHPERPLPSGALKVRDAQGFAAILLSLGIWEAYVAAGVPTLAFALTNVAALILYERWAKRQGLLGNLMVAALVASAFLFGAVATGTAASTWGLAVALAAMAFLSNVARELLKDIEDMQADTNRRRTLPMAIGPAPTRLLAIGAVLVAVVLSVVAWWYAPWPRTWGLLLGASNGVFLLGITQASAAKAQRTWKAAMLLALAAFLFGAMSKAS